MSTYHGERNEHRSITLPDIIFMLMVAILGFFTWKLWFSSLPVLWKVILTFVELGIFIFTFWYLFAR